MNNILAKPVRRLALLSIVGIVLLAAFFTGCSTLEGEKNPNKKPIVQFVNIPPAAVFDTTYDTLSVSPLVLDTVVNTIRGYTRFSRNPFVHWYGTDIDGQVSFYRYVVVTEDEMNSMTPAAYSDYLLDVLKETGPIYDTLKFDTIFPLETISFQPFIVEAEVDAIIDTQSIWTYLDVNPTEANPRTSEIVSLRAFDDDPVNNYLLQFIFVQAFDEEGEGSIIKFRGFERNDSPPITSIRPLAPPYINSRDTGIITGVRLSWSARDPDYPGGGDDVPPFDYQWRLYGPYNEQDYQLLQDTAYKQVFFTSDFRKFFPGETVTECDINPSGDTVSCDTVVLEDGVNPGGLINGAWIPYFDVDDTLFLNSSLNRVADRSDSNHVSKTLEPQRWTKDSSTTRFDVYHDYTKWYDTTGSDTTVEMKFVFWVKSRDDAKVEDVTPVFETVDVINPRFERSVLVVDLTFPQVASPHPLVLKGVWNTLIQDWGAENVPGWTEESFDPDLSTTGNAPDFHKNGPPLSKLLKHKVVIMFSDDVLPPNPEAYEDIFKAVDAGANIWATMRTPLIGGLGLNAMYDNPVPRGPGSYGFYFAADEISFSGWFSTAFDAANLTNHARVESFVGGISLNDSKWPNIDLDTALLHSNYGWPEDKEVPWIPSIAALPEVNRMSFRPRFEMNGVRVEAEGMYLFKSKYAGGDHPWDPEGRLIEYHGSPVAHRVKGDYFKSVHFLFTPLAFDPVDFQPIADTVLNYLYEPDINGPITKPRYIMDGF